jgi:serine/threonine protein kinase
VADNFPVDFGEYRLLRKLAQGGMAEIFLAQDRRGDICALKRILPHLAHEESFIRMFIDEARIVSHLDHPNIAGVYDQGKHAGYYYIAMEFVQGHSLLAVSERAKSMKIPLPRGLLAFVVAELLAGLGCAHSARDAKGRHLGIVHRDVTPQNVLISYDGEVKLIDFGVAKAKARLTQTEAGFTKGKLSYMSPEQARGEELDGRSDLFSVGIILHEITTNSRLFNKEGPGGILGAIVNDPIPKPSHKAKGYPKDLEAVVMRALDKEVNTRYQSAEEMRDALMRYARKERPVPGQNRLKDLTHDLFGEPDSQKLIDAAKATSAPTPRRVKAHGNAESKLIETSQIVKAREDSEMPVEDVTRMLRPDYELNPSRVSRVEITSDGTPVVKMPLPGRDDQPVPEPAVPQRVKLARYLTALASDLELSWRENRRRWLSGIAGAVFLLLGVVFVAMGGIQKTSDWMGNVARDAQQMRASAGLTEDVDAGTRPTVLSIVTEPPGATITVNGIGMGSVTPHEIEDLPTDVPLDLELSLAGYRTHSEKITLWENQGMKELTFTLVRKRGALLITSQPPGGRIYLDGKRTEHETPATIEGLTAGAEVNVKVRLKGHLAQSKVVVVQDGETRDVLFDLPIDERQIAPGRIQVDTSPTGCSVFVDGAYVGTSPLSGYEAKAGTHTVKVECENYGDDTRIVSVGTNDNARVSFALSPKVFGYLTVRPVPSQGSVVRLNGKRLPLPVEFRKVVPGRHVILVSNDRLNLRRELEVDVGPNQRITRRVNLIR